MRTVLHTLAERRPLRVLVLLWALCYLPWLSVAPLRGTLESNRLEAAREMLRSGDWVVPTLNGEPYLLKPPLQYWLISLASAPAGEVTVLGGRLVSTLCVLGLVLLVWRWSTREFGRTVGLLAGVAVATSGILIEKGVRAELEALLACTTAAAMFGAWNAVFGARRGLSLALAGCALAAALLVKGPVALLMFVPASIVLAFVARGRRGAVIASCSAILALALVGVLPWASALVARTGAEQPLQTLALQFLGRVKNAGSTNAEPFWFYGPALLGAIAPWCLLLPALAFVARPRELTPRERSAAAFLWTWAAGSLVLLSLSAGKETRYLIATVPAWSILIAWGFERGTGTAWFDRTRHVLGQGVAWLTWILPLALAGWGWKLAPDLRAPIAAIALCGLAARALVALGVERRRLAHTLLGFTLGLLTLKFFWARFYAADLARNHPLAELASFVQARVPRGEPLRVLGWYSASIQFAVDRPLLVFNDRLELEQALRERPAASEPSHPPLILADVRLVPSGWEGEFDPLAAWNVGGNSYRLFTPHDERAPEH